MERTSQVFNFYWFSLVLIFFVSNMIILIGLVILSSFQFLKILLYSQKGVGPPKEVFIHQASKVN